MSKKTQAMVQDEDDMDDQEEFDEEQSKPLFPLYILNPYSYLGNIESRKPNLEKRWSR
jgi:hypothetical protein